MRLAIPHESVRFGWLCASVRLHCTGASMLKTELKQAGTSGNSPIAVECGERRRHLRYDRAGTLTFESRGRRYSGALVNVSKSGLLFLADTPPPIEALGTITLEMIGFDGALIGDARVIRRYPTGAAI